MSIKFRRVVTGYRCHEENCYEMGVWYIETGSDFFHWCPKHAVRYMSDRGFWSEKLAKSGLPEEYAYDPLRSHRRRRHTRSENSQV